MSFVAHETIPLQELEQRHSRLVQQITAHMPHAAGGLFFSRVNIYYLTGHLANGVLWVPVDGAPVLLCRKGIERARLESTLPNISTFRSYSDLAARFSEAGSPLPPKGGTIGVDMSGLPWSLANLLQSKLPDHKFASVDGPIAWTRSVKSDWELNKMRLCGERHHRSLFSLLPQKLTPGMTERDVSLASWDVFYSQGHSGHLRMSNVGDEIFLGHVSAGNSANYPSVFNGPVGLMGEHPALPYMGNASIIWDKGQPLTVDIGFGLEGYATDKTQVYWSGPASSIPDSVKRAHDACIQIQNNAAEMMVPGALPSEIWKKTVELADSLGQSEGFMGLDSNKVCFLGHGIGLCIDEMPVIAKGFDNPLELKTVMALEPKIGIPGVGMVGVENTFEVTETGARCITGDDYSIVCVE